MIKRIWERIVNKIALWSINKVYGSPVYVRIQTKNYHLTTLCSKIMLRHDEAVRYSIDKVLTDDILREVRRKLADEIANSPFVQIEHEYDYVLERDVITATLLVAEKEGYYPYDSGRFASTKEM